MKGTIGLRNLKISCVVGIYDREREMEQTLLVDVEVDRDLESSVASQQVEDTVDYDWVARLLTDLAQARRYRLIESFAEEGSALLLQQFEDIEAVRMEVRKPGAVPAAAWAFVRVERTR